MKSLLLALLSAVLAGPALAQVNVEYPTKYDFTVRPKLYPHLVRKARDAKKPMTVEEAKALKEELFAAYQNIGALSRFRFHKRTKDEAPMTADELGWVETELKDEMEMAEKLAPEAEAALKTGIQRPEPWPKDFKNPMGKLKRMGIIGRFVLMTPSKPTYEHFRMLEQGAMGGIMSNLYELVSLASDREEDPKDDAKYAAEIRQMLSEDYAELASARKGMLGTVKEAEAQAKDEGATAGAARKRAVKAINAGPKGGGAAKGAGAVLEDRAGKSAGKTYDGGVRDGGGRITPEEAAAEANAAELRAANRKRGRSPAIVPAP